MCIKKILGLWSKLWKMSLIKVDIPFLNYSMKKTRKDLADLTLKIRIALRLNQKIKNNQRPRILLYTPRWSWGQLYSPLNSAMLNWKSEVTQIPCTFAIALIVLITYNVSKVTLFIQNWGCGKMAKKYNNKLVFF